MHGELAGLPLPTSVGRELISQGKVSPHHFLPQSGWVSYYIGEADIPKLIELFRMQYDRMTGYGK